MSRSETTTEPAEPEVAELPVAAPAEVRPAEDRLPGERMSVPARGSTWRDAMTGQLEAVWRGLGVRDNSRHRPVHAAPPDQRAERIAAAGMGLLVLIGALITYLAVVGAIDPLLAPAPAGGAPPAVVRSVTPMPTAPPQTATPTTTEPALGASTEPTGPRERSHATAPATSRQSVPTATPTPTAPPPTTTSPPPSPSPSPSG